MLKVIDNPNAVRSKGFGFVDGERRGKINPDNGEDSWGGVGEVERITVPEADMLDAYAIRYVRAGSELTLGEAARVLGISVTEMSGLELGTKVATTDVWHTVVIPLTVAGRQKTLDGQKSQRCTLKTEDE